MIRLNVIGCGRVGTTLAASWQREGLAPVFLTATRTSETIEGKWGEVHSDKAIWTIPKERMKKGREHRAPLSDQAMEVLKSI